MDLFLPTGLIREELQESPREQRKGRDHIVHRNWATPEIADPRASVMEETSVSDRQWTDFVYRINTAGNGRYGQTGQPKPITTNGRLELVTLRNQLQREVTTT